jgi:hypothetical protein
VTDRSIEITCLLLAAVVLLFSGRQPAQPAPCPPSPPHAPDAKRPRKPWWPWRGVDDDKAARLALAPAAPGASVGGPVSPAGVPMQCALPGKLHRRNTASKGLGNCVFTSIHHAAVWQNVPALFEFPRFLIDSGIPGGGYPSKVDTLIARICKERKVPVPEYLQVQSNDLAVLRKALKGGRMVSSTYGRSLTGRYRGQHIDHMVNTVHMDDTHAAVLDNNYPGEAAYEWLTLDEWARAYKDGSSAGWSVILLTPPPAPRPRSAPTPK